MPAKIYISETDVGKGIFAKKVIKKGEVILKFSGPIINRQFIEKRNRREKQCRWGDPLQIGDDKYINIEKPGVLVNHSCNPNAGIKKDEILVAIRNIKRDEEIRFDYSTTMDESDWTMECKCHQKNCRKIIKDFKYLTEKTRKKYLKLGVVQKFIAEKYS